MFARVKNNESFTIFLSKFCGKLVHIVALEETVSADLTGLVIKERKEKGQTSLRIQGDSPVVVFPLGLLRMLRETKKFSRHDATFATLVFRL